jgi:hypothetical protein
MHIAYIGVRALLSDRFFLLRLHAQIKPFYVAVSSPRECIGMIRSVKRLDCFQAYRFTGAAIKAPP